MDQIRWIRDRAMHSLHSLLLVVSLAGILGLLSAVIGGKGLSVLAIGTVGCLYFLNPLASPYILLRFYRSRMLGYADAPGLHDTVRILSQRAGLEQMPKLYYIPGNMTNAFAVGTGENAALAVSHGLLRRLNDEEIAGVLAHEISHIRNRDTGIMSFAALTGYLIQVFSIIGQLVLLFHLPLVLLGKYQMSFAALLIVFFSPWISTLIQFALSRTREYAADLSAAELLGNPMPLAKALAKLETFQEGLLRRMIWMPYSRQRESAIWRTHPLTPQRIQRLLNLRKTEPQPFPYTPRPAYTKYQKHLHPYPTHYLRSARMLR